MILLDTDIIIEIVDKHSEKGESVIKKILDSGEGYCTSSLNVHELMYGIHKYSKDGASILRIPVINYTKEDGELSSRLEISAEQKGKAVPRMDSMIASIAINNNCNFYTFDDHFRVFTDSGLKLFEQKQNGPADI